MALEELLACSAVCTEVLYIWTTVHIVGKDYPQLL